MNIDLILYVLAAIAFGLEAFGIGGSVRWTPLGFCLITLATWVI